VDGYLSDASDAERLLHVLSHTEARVTRQLEKVLAQERTPHNLKHTCGGRVEPLHVVEGNHDRPSPA
jgi:hypothetical protein